MAGPGQTGFNALGEILAGGVNPSAKMVDTYVYDLTQTPTWNNFGSMFYDNMDEFAVDGAVPSFVNYVEGIYVGYKFYETAAPLSPAVTSSTTPRTAFWAATWLPTPSWALRSTACTPT